MPDIFEQLLCRKFSWFYFRLAFSTHCAYSSWGNSCPLALKDSPVDRLLTSDQTVGHHKCKWATRSLTDPNRQIKGDRWSSRTWDRGGRGGTGRGSQKHFFSPSGLILVRHWSGHIDKVAIVPVWCIIKQWKTYPWM